MTVEEMKGDSTAEADKFPVGMRVLAVDDDPTCLKLLESLLGRCQYQVTVTSQAKMALKLLRENKNRFDLVISDVHMPDMDGFKLLEHVGLEMDLPVIMLSAYSDTSLVMKGITHGACDYLLKPIRLEELKNIWQHVVRKNKCNSNHQSKPIPPPPPPPPGFEEQTEKLNRKRKEEEDDDGREEQEKENENDDPMTQKKPRVVWTIELHRQFVYAVNQLGIEKAVPKRILDLMNVQGLTRENVASHLQKYRLYLKRISAVAKQQQASMVGIGSFGLRDMSYLRASSLDGLGDFQALPCSGRFASSGSLMSSSSSSTGGMLGRFNGPIGMNLLHPSNHRVNPTQSVSDVGKFQPLVLTPAQNNITMDQSKFNGYYSGVNGQGSFAAAPVNMLQNSRIPQIGILNSKSLNGVDGSVLDNGRHCDNMVSNTLPGYGQLTYNEGLKSNYASNGVLMNSPINTISPSPVYPHVDLQCHVPQQRWGQNQADLTNHDGLDTNHNSLTLHQKPSQDLVIFDQSKHVGVFHNSYDGLDDIMSDVIKQEGIDGIGLMDGELFGLDESFPFSSSL